MAHKIKIMSCNHPLKAFWTGNYTENGKKEYIICKNSDIDMIDFDYVLNKGFKIDRTKADYVLKGGRNWLINPLTIPCGYCLACRLAKSKEWTTRICLESTYYQNIYFLTLTYNDNCLPKDHQLNKRDLRNFIKRLRKYITIRYFACGEYGDDKNSKEGFGRPHYHLIIMTDDELKVKPTFKPGAFSCGLISKLWPFGNYELNFANDATIAYTAGYVYKKQLNQVDHHEVKPFISASDKPGMGYRYLVDHYQSILDTKKIYLNGKAKPVFKYIWSKIAEKVDIEPIKNELMIQAGYSSDKLKWYFNNKITDECGFMLDEIYSEYLENKRKGTL